MITVDYKIVEIEDGYKILDIGCGSGRHTASLYDYKKVDVTGADLRHKDLMEAKGRLEYHDELEAHKNGSWALSVSDITNLPFKNQTFDLVICSEVMEHVPDEGKAINELIRVLKNGKNLVVSVPRFWPEKICWVLAKDYNSANDGHIRIYKKNDIIKKFEKGGVKKWKHHHAHSIHSPYWWLKCLVGPNNDKSIPVRIYHKFLTWDIMKKPFLSRAIDKIFNPIMGKSLVLYFKK
ncbi:MAG: class I SAM-dependent methyltransferase [Desulfobacterales bacterium]|nr:class I SAM-dependent methyltransferase [Desulfobacterales bacterium]MCP4160168.1 class I SAM-dependent methyltransferase [Deltaproteobacteria bacterium]